MKFSIRPVGNEHPPSFRDTLPPLLGDESDPSPLERVARLFADSDRVQARAENRTEATLNYLQRVRPTLLARAITIYVQGHDSTSLRVLLGHGEPTLSSVENRGLFEAGHLSGELKTMVLKPDSLGLRVTPTTPPMVISCCLTWHDMPLIVLYEFEGPIERDSTQLAHMCSREICHLLRTEELQLRFACLESIARSQRLLPDRREVFWEICRNLKAYFQEQAVAILVNRSAGDWTMEKYFTHFARTGYDTFPARFGLARYSIERQKALIVSAVDEHAKPPLAECLEYELEDLIPGKGNHVQVPSLATVKAVENEKSMILFPFRSEARSGAAGVVKVGSLSHSNAFNIGHLRALRSFARMISAAFTTMDITEQLNRDHALLMEKSSIAEHAPALFYYRHTALGIFHQVGNSLNTLGIQLIESQIVASDIGGDTVLPELIEQSIDQINIGKRLIKTAMDRGRRLKANPSRCKLLDGVVRPAIDQAQKILKDANWGIRHSLTSDEYRVFLDAELMRESLFNLLNNAIRAVKENKEGGRREVFVAVRALDDGERVRIEISDTGIGMTPEASAGLFKPFHTTHGNEGSGLGLYFAKNLIEESGGTIELDRTLPGKGTIFVITLPIAQENSHA